MTQPTLEERKIYWRWTYAAKCFVSVKTSMEYIRKNPISDPDVAAIFLAGVITTYAKPFIKSYGVGFFDEKIIPTELLKVHRHILDLRHKAYAHIDAVDYKADDPEFGNINQVVIWKDKSSYGFQIILQNSIDDLKTLKIHDLCCKLLEKSEYHTSRFERKFVSVPELRPGKYLLNIDPQDARAFIPNPKSAKHLNIEIK
jgi:hypothetical protein